MHFLTNEQWEVKNEFFKAMSPPGTRMYPIVELSLNYMIFHVDMLAYDPPGPDDGPDDEPGGCWKRLMTIDIDCLLDAIHRAPYDELTVSLQSRRCDNDNDEYGISTIQEIIEAEDSAGQRSFVYVCVDGKRHINSALANNEDELKNKKVVYNQK